MVYILLADGFEEIEALAPLDFLRRAGISVATVSIGDSVVLGAHNIPVAADDLLSRVDFSSAEIIVLPGGMPGTKNLDACPQMTEILSAVHRNGGILAAICAAPMVLGKRGYLNGKRATCYPGFEEHLTGAQVCPDGVVVDGRVITAKGMGVAQEFGLALVSLLCGNEKADAIRKAIQAN